MGIPRTTIVKGPAVILINSQYIYTQGDIEVSTRIETFMINCSIGGKIDERISNIITELTFTPVGMWTTGLLAVLFPYTNPVAGTSLFTATDVPVVIWPLNGVEKISYAAGAVTKMPSLALSAVKSAFGSMTITCIGKNTTDLSAADKRFTITATSAFADTSLAVSSIPTVSYSIVITGGSAPWNAIRTKDGVSIDFNLGVETVETDDEGVVDYAVKGLDITAKFIPVGVTLTELLTKLAIQGSGMARGISLNSRSANITIAGAAVGNPSVVLNAMALKDTKQSYSDSSSKLRIGEIGFVSTRPNGTGAMFSVGVVPAP
jgi:hypothetical protein